MTTTMGDLIAGLFSTYQRQYQDGELASIATAVRVDQLLRARRRGRRTR